MTACSAIVRLLGKHSVDSVVRRHFSPAMRIFCRTDAAEAPAVVIVSFCSCSGSVNVAFGPVPASFRQHGPVIHAVFFEFWAQVHLQRPWNSWNVASGTPDELQSRQHGFKRSSSASLATVWAKP